MRGLETISPRKSRVKWFPKPNSNVVTHHSTNPAHRCLTSVDMRFLRYCISEEGFAENQAFFPLKKKKKKKKKENQALGPASGDAMGRGDRYFS